MNNNYFQECLKRKYAYQKTLTNFRRQFTNYEYYLNSDSWQRTQNAENDLANSDLLEKLNPTENIIDL